MSKELTLTQASQKAYQLASLLSVVSAHRFDGIDSADGENLVDLASDLSGEVAVFLGDLSAQEGQQAPEKCPACSGLPSMGDRYKQNDCGMVAIVEARSGIRVAFCYEQNPEARHYHSLEAFLREFTHLEVQHA